MLTKGLYRKMAVNARGLGLVILAGWLILPACSMEAGKSNNDLRKEIEGLKSEIAALKEKVDKLQGGQQAILDLLKRSGAPSPETALLPEQPPTQGGGPQSLTVGQLLAEKDRYMGARVTVKGDVGPVLVHHKSLLLKSPGGMVEVFFGKLPDQKQVQRLTSMTMDHPITVTGVVSPALKGGAKLEIQAEAIDF
jgi:hypothetical protein